MAILSQYYYLTRSKTEQDASLYAMQQQGCTDEQLIAAKAQIADLLTAMNEQIAACYAQLAAMPQPVVYAAQVCYATVPGWCCRAGCFVPDWYYDNGCFVGPCCNAAWAGPWAGPVFVAYHNHGSHFYAAYHHVANATYANRSRDLAKRSADWLRGQGNWRAALAHDRLLNRARTANRQPAAQLRPKIQGHVGSQPLSKRAVHATARPVQAGGHEPVVHQQKSTPRPGHVSAAHRPPVVHQAAKPHASHAAAAHAHAPRPAAHASHPRPAAHASHPHSAPHAHASAGHASGRKHR